MSNKKRGLTLIEVMIAGLILLLVVGLFVVTYVSFESRLATYRYHYTAINLARDCLEFGESIMLRQRFFLKYSYSPLDERYQLTEWVDFNPADPNPFDYMDDIKAKGLVPKNYPDDVVITYEASQHNFPDTGDLFLTTVGISWKENLPGREQTVQREEELAVVPITNYNDQLNLTTGRFWWEKR